jgi:hypothetical protein
MRYAALAALLLAGPASAQVAHADGGGVCTLYADGDEARPGPALADRNGERARRAAVAAGAPVQRVVSSGGAATFDVRYTGFTAEARAAFQEAVDIWAAHLTSGVLIKVEATFEELGERTLGSAGPRLTRDFPGAPTPSTWYPFPLADAVAGRDLFPNQPADDPDTDIDERFNYDIRARFNSEFDDWYFGLDGQTPAGEFDFVTVVLHELGHGLGFVGSAAYDDGVDSDECEGTAGRGCWGYFDGSFFGFPIIFDRFVEDVDGVALLDGQAYPNNSLDLGTLIQSNDLFIDAETVTEVNGGERPPVWAPSPFEPGSSFSHWDENLERFPDGAFAALMTPTLNPGESYQDPGALTCAFFQDMGWSLAPGCSSLFTPAEAGPLAAGPALVLEGPNPFRARTRLRLARADRQPAPLALVDALGRTVRTLTTGPDGAVEVSGAGLAPGLYVVRVEGAPLAVPVVRAR